MQATAAAIATDAQAGTQAPNVEQGAGALLLVSGGHPVRRLPIVRNFLPMDAVAMLQEGRRLRERDLLPKGGGKFARVLYLYSGLRVVLCQGKFRRDLFDTSLMQSSRI